jgi:hypothetical protein
LGEYFQNLAPGEMREFQAAVRADYSLISGFDRVAI